MPESRFLTQLNLSPEQRREPPKMLGRLKTIQEWASAAIDSVKENGDFLAAIKDVSPWAEAAFSAAKDTLAPVKFVVKVFEELTKIQDPEELARLGCTLAYQAAAERAIANAGPPAMPASVGAKVDEAVEEVDFSTFTLNQVVMHAFVAQADRTLGSALTLGGFSPEQMNQVIDSIHEELPADLNILLTNGKSKEKFDPLYRWLQLPAEGRLSRAALRRHAEYIGQPWLAGQGRDVLPCP